MKTKAIEHDAYRYILLSALSYATSHGIKPSLDDFLSDVEEVYNDFTEFDETDVEIREP